MQKLEEYYVRGSWLKSRPTEGTTVAAVNVGELKSKLGNFDSAQIYRVHGIVEHENKRTSDGLESSRGEAGLKTIGGELPFWIPPGGTIKIAAGVRAKSLAQSIFHAVASRRDNRAAWQ